MNVRTKTLYPHQIDDINTIFSKIESAPRGFRLLYQLPTGGGKTVIFSEIAKRFVDRYQQKVVILTHRTELCRQTANTLKSAGVNNKIINSTTRKPDPESPCYVAMVETLRNRIKAKKVSTKNVGLVIIDEAHHNSFRKLLKYFPGAFVIGVTATPFSADIEKPMKKYYDLLVTGPNISTLIGDGFLAKPETHIYEVELNTLKTGIHGDYSVGSSNALYGSKAMLDLLLEAYSENANKKKTLIFNNGVETSLKVRDHFADAGFAIKHLDHQATTEERNETLQWFRKTKDAILTSISILTTGFDEPSVQAVILNRATTSITLYHQMVGRGSRRLPSKKTFRVIDLGNNATRFGDWHEPVDWHRAFENPAAFAGQIHHLNTSTASHSMSAELRLLFPNTLEQAFDIDEAYFEAIHSGNKAKIVIRDSLRQHAMMCIENSDDLTHALRLADALLPEIEWRVKQYVKCLDKTTKSYKDWLLDDYKSRLSLLIRKLFNRIVQSKAS